MTHAGTRSIQRALAALALVLSAYACFAGGGGTFLQWPCTRNKQPIPSYKGYDYVSEVLASHGYVVVSVSANGINAVDNSVFDLGATARRSGPARRDRDRRW